MSKEIISIGQIAQSSYFLRGQKVIPDFGLAAVYGAATGHSNRAGKRYAGTHDEEMRGIIDAIRQLMAPSEKPKREIGFHVREQTARYRTHKRRKSRSPLPL